MVDFEKVEAIAFKLTSQYIAGFFDGEGSITVTKTFGLQVVISQNDETILLAIAKFFGNGSVSAAKQRRGHKVAFTLRWCGAKAAKVLEILKEFLVLKKERAELGIRLASTMTFHRKQVPQNVIEDREQIASEIKRINDSHWSRRPMSEAVN